MEQCLTTLYRLSGMTLYRRLKKDSLVKHFLSLVTLIREGCTDLPRVIGHYSSFCGILYQSEWEGSLPDYLLDQIRCDENAFTVKAAREDFQGLPKPLVQAAAFDLGALWELSRIDSLRLKTAMAELFPEQGELIFSLADYGTEGKSEGFLPDWGNAVKEIAEFHRKNGVSVFAKYAAFQLSEKKEIVPVRNPEEADLSGIVKYEYQKEQLTANTLSFLQGKPAHNALLYGDRGTGKSTMVHAVLQEYHTQGLRMIQLAKEDICYLSRILKRIGEIPLHFILFMDDLTFTEDEESFAILKAVLEGSLSGMPKNALIYATTNRRHLIKETFTSREGDELHAGDTRDEYASLADRFGLMITFTQPNLADYLEIVCGIARSRALPAEEEALIRGAKAFAVKKGSRSGRVARQYVDLAERRLSLGLPL